MRAQWVQAQCAQTVAIKRGVALLEVVLITHCAIAAREHFDESHAAAQLGQCRQAQIQFTCIQVMQHIAAH